MLRSLVSLCLGIAVTLCLAMPASAQSYPSKPIKMIVPSTAGGITDFVGRLAAEQISTMSGQPVIVENRPGAGGAVGMEAVAKATPDGYTLGAINTGDIIGGFLHTGLSFDPFKDLLPVAMFAEAPQLLVVSAHVPTKTFQEFLAYARANPGKINYGHQGKGQTGHLLGELLMLKGKFRMTEIPYRGSAPAINDLLAGNIDLVPDYLLANKSNIDAGKLKLLATGSRERLKDYPRVATVAETLPGVFADTWMAVAAPPGTPGEITKKVSQAIRQGFREPQLRGRIRALEADPLASTPDEMRGLIRQSVETWGPVIEAAKIVVE
jgi:tripartite-type tricarboxylate transporter receptor subunit TctC